MAKGKGKGRLGFGKNRTMPVKPSGAPAKNVAGGPGKSFAQSPIPGPGVKGGKK
jgi:hypothetical protein